MPRSAIPALSLVAVLSAVMLTGAACAPVEDDGKTLVVECEGKCDESLGSSLRDLRADLRKLDTGDFLSVASDALWREASGQLNDLLSGLGFARIGSTQAFALKADAQADLTLGDVDQLVTSLAAKYGERELTTQINALRRAELMAHPGAVFAESSFQLDGGINREFSLPADAGLDGLGDSGARIGFQAGKANRFVIVRRVDNEREAYLREPLKAALGSRGFVMPMTVADVAAMDKGEVFARSGGGVAGVNLRANMLVAAAGYGYGLVFDPMFRMRIVSDNLEVQVARLEGDEVVVDVGVSDFKSISWRLAVENGFGALGMTDVSPVVGKAVVKLNKLAERAIARKFREAENGKLMSISVSGRTYTGRQGAPNGRLSVTRLRFNLDAMDAEGRSALARALHGDTRHAQALAWKKAPGVRCDFDMLRSGRSATRHAGVQLLGMRFFSDRATADGQIELNTPQGGLALLYNTLRTSGGLFGNSHDLNRVGLGGLIFGPGGEARGQTHLFVETRHRDTSMERDGLLDHVDALIRTFAGAAALDGIERTGNQLLREIQTLCASTGGDAIQASACSRANLSPTVRAAALATLEPQLTALPTPTAGLVRSLAELRLAASVAHEFPATFTGVSAAVRVDQRIDDGAFSALLSAEGAARLRAAMLAYLESATVKRDVGDLEAQRAALRAKHEHALEVIAQVVRGLSARYQQLAAAETASIATIGTLGANVLEVRFDVANGEPDYDSALAQSFAEGRRRVAVQLYDQLAQTARAAFGSSPYTEQVVSHALLGATPAEQRDVRVDINFQLPSEADAFGGHYALAGYRDVAGYIKGERTARIESGSFDIDALLIAGND